MGAQVWESGPCRARQVRTGHRPGAQDLCGKDGQQSGRKQKSKLLFPAVAFRAMLHQDPVTAEAEEPLWVNEFQGQLGTQFCQKHPLNLAMSHVFGENSKVRQPGSLSRTVARCGRSGSPEWLDTTQAVKATYLSCPDAPLACAHFF